MVGLMMTTTIGIEAVIFCLDLFSIDVCLLVSAILFVHFYHGMHKEWEASASICIWDLA